MIDLLDLFLQGRDILRLHALHNIHGKAAHAELIQQDILANHGLNVIRQIG